MFRKSGPQKVLHDRDRFAERCARWTSRRAPAVGHPRKIHQVAPKSGCRGRKGICRGYGWRQAEDVVKKAMLVSTGWIKM